MLRSLEQTISFLTQELKRLDKAIDDHIDRHPDLKEDERLLTSIPGIGPRVGRIMMAIMHNHCFNSAQGLAAYLGLVPVPRQSGSSFLGRCCLAKNGPGSVRAMLYLAAMSAVRYNPHVQALYTRLQANGKSKMSALGAAMRKLVHQCFGVLKTRHEYRPDYALSA
ncbi:transposase IS116/IS110/IS902 family protein [Paracandidimonas soli]|uniref:Transposase IS116/IS110/IS902 family protein n=1 Tax=Paracandidimonas soli TaxID=1917182 RepID=A0A4V2VRL8_9BURK|nr:transposase IS116/IS110/IS902 family protein [Paracandidimonas soli]